MPKSASSCECGKCKTCRWHKRRVFQQTRRLSTGVVEYACGCGKYLAQPDQSIGECADCLVKDKIKDQHQIELNFGFCIYCGDLAPGICGTCDREKSRGKIPRVTG